MTMTACARAARVVLAAVVFASFSLPKASAAEYRFVRIADSADGGFFLDPSRHVAINNAGDVALYKSLPGFTAGYFRGNGGALSTIVTTDGGPLAGLTLHRPSFNDSGQIAFVADDISSPNPFRVYRAGPGGVTLIATTGAGTFNGLVPNVSINNSGHVAYTVAASGALDGMYVGDGAVNLRRYGDGLDGVSVGSGPSLNNSGTASFAGSYVPVGGSAHLKGDGGTPAVIASTAANDVSMFVESVINDGGLVAFGATRFSGPQGIFIGSGGSHITTFVDIDGPYSNLPIHYGTGFAAPGYPTMNNAGTIAFDATLDAGGEGIFTGVDPATSAVIKVGDALFGREVGNFFGGLGREAINDAGEIAFQVSFVGGTEVVVKAIPAVDMKWADDSDGVWSDAGNWVGPVPDAYHHDANFTDAITAPRTVTVDGAVTVGSINFDNVHSYTLAGPGTIRLDDSYKGQLRALSGTHTISAPLAMPRDTDISVAADALLILDQNVTMAADRKLTKHWEGTLRAHAVAGGIVVLLDGTLEIAPNGTPAATSTFKQLVIAGVADAWEAKLDLNNNDLVIDYEPFTSPLATVANQIKSARGTGSWTGNGITSSMADASNFALGYAEASALFTSFPAVFSGQTVDDTTVLIAYTRYGDADLNGTVGLSDFNRLASNFGLAGRVWSEGDFNYDGIVNLIDFNLLAGNFGLSAGPDGIVDPADWSALASAVPEPASAWWLAGTVGALWVRRRRARAGG